MRKMKLVPADVRVKQIQSDLARQFFSSNRQPAHEIETQTEAAAAAAVHPPQEDAASQTDHMYNRLIRRYVGYVDQVIKLLKARNFKWFESQLRFRDPPDVHLIPTIEHLARNFMQATDPAIIGIEDVVLGRRKPRSDDDEPPPRLSPVASRRLAKPFRE
jgi:hypothetical protein